MTASTFCQNIPLTPALVGEIGTLGLTTSVQANTSPAPLLAWSDSRLTQALLANPFPMAVVSGWRQRCLPRRRTRH